MLDAISEGPTKSLNQKTMFGLNAERKLVTAKSAGAIADITGIPNNEMFGTNEGSEKVLYVGAPYQARGIADEARFTYIDYEFAEIANFVKSHDDLYNMANDILVGGDSSRRNVFENYREIKNGSDNPSITDFERNWFQPTYDLAVRIKNRLDWLKNNNDEGLISDLTDKINTELVELHQMLDNRLEIEKEKIEARKKIDRETDSLYMTMFGRHPIEEFSDNLNRFYTRISQGMKDVHDYNTIVKPRLETYYRQLPTDLSPKEYGEKMKLEELNILNELRLKKQTKEATVVAALFPDLPFKEESYDRAVFSYSISTHVIAEMKADDFRLWWKEIERILKPGGKAYIFPIEQGFPYGRTYDGVALHDTLKEYSPENGHHLTAEIVGHNHAGRDGDGSFLSETLVITKK
jgi:hypothetical protein